jgi:SAM-dependent methyltransferase
VSSSLLGYYARRADEYEQIYHKPERQDDLRTLGRWLEKTLAGHRVLELACGTGYWTAIYARATDSVLATDLSPEVLSLAREKSYPDERVRFAVADAYRADRIPGSFTAVFAGFWWSHVPRQRLATFLDRLHRRGGRGTQVLFCDNRYVEGSSTPIARWDVAGNSYQHRRLQAGHEYEVLKNFPTSEEIAGLLAGAGAAEIRLTQHRYYWTVSYLVDLPNLPTTR